MKLKEDSFLNEYERKLASAVDQNFIPQINWKLNIKNTHLTNCHVISISYFLFCSMKNSTKNEYVVNVILPKTPG